MKKNKEITKTIITAMKTSHKCKIVYLKASTNEVVKRVVSPYEIKDGYLLATDDKDFGAHIRSYILDNIKKISITKTTFIPNWELKC